MKIQQFTTDQWNLINKGATNRSILKGNIREALSQNRFKENYIISSLPGLGKSYEMQEALKTIKNPPIIFNGSASFFTYFIDICTAKYLAKGKPFCVINDDCDMLFDDKIINITKKAFDSAQILRYGKSYNTLKSLCSDVQWEALEHFASPDRAGIDLDVSDITFIILTNLHLNDVDEVEACEPGSAKYAKYNARYAIRRRGAYEEIAMPVMELWGYVADVVLNDRICEKFMPDVTEQLKHQMLEWCYNKWDGQITERNLSVIEKMTKDVVRYPTNYLDIWEKKYAKAKTR